MSGAPEPDSAAVLNLFWVWSKGTVSCLIVTSGYSSLNFSMRAS